MKNATQIAADITARLVTIEREVRVLSRVRDALAGDSRASRPTTTVREPVARRPLQPAILAELERAGRPMSARAVAAAIGRPLNSVSPSMTRMAQAGKIRHAGRGMGYEAVR